MKCNILNSITSPQKLKNIISKLVENIKPNAAFKARLSQSLLAFTKANKSLFAWQWQKVFASTLLVVITFMAATVYISDIPVIKAARQTTIINVSGDVELIREGEVIMAEADMYLQQGDILITGDTGTVIVRYIDDSVSRLSPNSELKIKKLFQDQIKKSKTEVEIEVKKGKVWNQVVNIVGKDSSFTVETKDVIANASERSSFEVKEDNNIRTLVSVYDNKIEVSLKDEKKMILEGYSIAANPISPQIEKIRIDTVEDRQWVDENIKKDKQYKNDVIEENKVKTKEEAGLTPDNPIYSAKKINESAKLFLTSDPAENAKLKIGIAIKRLNEAAVYISEDKNTEADPLIQEFKAIIAELNESLSDSEELKEYFIDAISDKSKDFTVVLPNDPLYKIKEALREAKKTIAVNDKEIQTVELEEAGEKIIEAKDLLKEEKNEIALEILIEAQKQAEDKEAVNSVKVLVEIVEDYAISSSDSVIEQAVSDSAVIIDL